MKTELSILKVITWRIRLFLYISSLSSLLFMQNYCTNICPFIDGLSPDDLLTNLGIVFLFHIFYRETLFRIYDGVRERTSLPRQFYYLSVVSWVLAGVTAFTIHAIKYPDFPMGSHLKLLSSYWILGAAILAQLEYIIFEKRYKSIAKESSLTEFNEKISSRFKESFFLFTLAPTLTLLMVITRYTFDGTIDSHVMKEVLYIGIMFVSLAMINSYIFGNMLKKDTEKIIHALGHIKEQNFSTHISIARPDELGEISHAINDMTCSIKKGIKEISDLNKEITDTQKEVVYTMGAIAEERSKETGNHVKRVASYSELLALKYGLSKDESALLRLASPMHDIGKVAIPDSILNKPGKHTPEEFEVMKSHAVIGYEMLKHSTREILKTAAIVAYEHHEKYDGSGYPRGVKGEDIHIYGRITALADVFDALGSDRVYKKAWEDEKIFELIREQSGKHFDPELVDIFFTNLDEINIIRDEYKDII